MLPLGEAEFGETDHFIWPEREDRAMKRTCFPDSEFGFILSIVSETRCSRAISGLDTYVGIL
jgi:hypothetical protein